MKRTLLLAIAAIFISSLSFAAPTTVEVGSSMLSVMLNSQSDMSSYDFGFSSTPVTQWSTKATPVAERMPLIPVLDANTGKFYASLAEKDGQTLYVYWRLYSLKTVTLKLSINGPMVNSSTQEPLRWFADWKDPAMPNPTEPKLDSNKPNTLVTVQTCPALLTLQAVAGSKKLHVFTENLLDKSTLGTYSGTITLTVEVQ